MGGTRFLCLKKSIHDPKIPTVSPNCGGRGRCFRSRALKVRYLDPRNEVLEAYSDHSKAKRVLKVSSDISLEKGLRRFAAWAREQGPRESKGLTDIDIEIPINLPPFCR